MELRRIKERKIRSFEKASEPKDYIRQTLCEFTKEYTNARKILTMPGPEVLDVPLFKTKLNNPVIHCVEKNLEAFNDILDKEVDVHKATIKEYLDSLILDQKGFNMVWFDYLGWLQPSVEDDIVSLLTNKHLWIETQHSCIIGVTLRRDSRAGANEDIEWLEDNLSNKEVTSHNNLSSKDKEAIILNIMRKSDKDNMFNIKILLDNPYEYRNNEFGDNMIFMCFLVNKV